MTIWSKMREAKCHSQATELKTQNYLDLDKFTILDPAHQQNTQVLQPIPAQQTNYKMSSYDSMLTKNINISDFESDTSSPFDNMELKTINDLEELASVLKPLSVFNNANSKNFQLSELNNSQYHQAPIYNNSSENYRNNEFLYDTNTQTNQLNISTPIFKSIISEDKSKATFPPVTMPNILLQLEADLNALKYNDVSPVSI